MNNNLYRTEFLDTLAVNGLPLHKLELKVGAPIMLLRYLNVEVGLRNNGTTIRVLNISNTIIHAKITSGSHVGNTAFGRNHIANKIK